MKTVFCGRSMLSKSFSHSSLKFIAELSAFQIKRKPVEEMTRSSQLQQAKEKKNGEKSVGWVRSSVWKKKQKKKVPEGVCSAELLITYRRRKENRKGINESEKGTETKDSTISKLTNKMPAAE